MLIPHADRVRRVLRERGMTTVAAVEESGRGRQENATIEPADLVEDATLRVRPVGPAEEWAGPVAFLDGSQRSEVVGYAGVAPLVIAGIGAAVRERSDRVLRTAVAARRSIAIGRVEALAAAGDALDGFDQIPLPDDHVRHPVRDLAAAARALERARRALEVSVGATYRATSAAWLVIDGALTESPAWAADLFAVGVARSHTMLPFAGADLEHYLRLPQGHRTSIFAPRSRAVTPVRAWALRLWPWEGRDVFHGLIRVEVCPENGITDVADHLSRRLLAERAPISTPELHWDRLLYGIHSVRQYLRAGETS